MVKEGCFEPSAAARLVGAFKNSHCEGAGESESDPHSVLFVPGEVKRIKAKKEDLQFHSFIHSLNHLNYADAGLYAQ